MGGSVPKVEAGLTEDVELTVRFFFGTKCKADLDNFNKLWQNALAGFVYEG